MALHELAFICTLSC